MLIIKQDKYPIPPVRKALKENGFKWSNKHGGFVGKITEQNKGFLKLLGYV